MTQEVHTPPLPPAAVAGARSTAVPVAAAPAASRSAMDYVDAALESLWRGITSMRVAMVIMIILAALCVAGSLLIQISADQASDSALRDQFTSMLRLRFGGWTMVYIYGPGVVTLGIGIVLAVVGVVRLANGQAFGWPLVGGAGVAVLGVVVLLTDQFGLFNVFNSLLFRALVAVLSISLVACTVHRIPGAWRTATKPRVDVGPGFFEHAPQREQIVVHESAASTLETVQTVLRKRHYRLITLDDGTVHLYADRFRFMSFASLAGHVALLFILAGAIVGNSGAAFRNSYFAVAEGTTVPTGTEDGLSLKLIDFTDSYYATTGAPEDYTSQVVLLKDGQQVAAQTIRVNEPMTYNGATYYQRSFGPAVVVTVKDASGNVVFSNGIPLDRGAPDGSDRAAGIVPLPSGELIAVEATDGTSDKEIQPGQVQMTLYTDALATAAKDARLFDQTKAQALGSYTVTFDREAKYTVLSITRDPGQVLVWLGALLLFGGFTLVFLLPQRRVWARITPRGAMSVLSVASLGRRDAALGTDFDDLVTDIRTALQAPAQA